MKKMQWILSKTVVELDLQHMTTGEGSTFTFLTPIPPWLSREDTIANVNKTIQDSWPRDAGEKLSITHSEPVDPFTASAEAISYTIEGLVASIDFIIDHEQTLKTEVAQLTAQLASKQLALQNCKNRIQIMQDAKALLEGKQSERTLVLIRQLSHVDSAVVDITEVVEQFGGDKHQAVEAITSLFYLTRTHASVRLFDKFDGDESSISMWKLGLTTALTSAETWAAVVKNVKSMHAK